MPAFSPRVGCLLLYLILHTERVFGQIGGNGEGLEGGGGTGAANASSNLQVIGNDSSLGLPPELNAAFAVTLVVAIGSAIQLWRSLARLKRLPISRAEPTLMYDVGIPFRILLAFYTGIYTLTNALYAAEIASFGDNVTVPLPLSFDIGVAFIGHLSLTLFYAIFLSIIAHRQRIQLNPRENWFNLKALLDSLLLLPILCLGVAEAVIEGAPISVENTATLENIIIALHVFGLLTSLDVVILSLIVKTQLSKCRIQDKIINTWTFVISPIVLMCGIYGITSVAVERNANPITFDFDGLLVANVVVNGTLSLVAISFCLNMGTLLTLLPQANHGRVVGKKEIALSNA